jgi:hypothetical protein
MPVVPKNFQNGRPRAGDFVRLAAQPACQRRHFLPFVRVCVRLHCSSKSQREFLKSSNHGND